MAHDEQLAGLLGHPDAARIRSSKLKGDIAALVVDASGLGPDDRSALEERLKAAALVIPGVAQVRVALTVSRPER